MSDTSFCIHPDCSRMASRHGQYCGSHIPHYTNEHDTFKCDYCNTFIKMRKKKRHPHVCPCRPKIKEFVCLDINSLGRQVAAPIQIELEDIKTFFDDFEIPIIEPFNVVLDKTLFKSNIQEYIISKIVKSYIEKMALSNYAIIDFGSGKGELLHYIRMALNEVKDTTYIAVDRKAFKFKFDRMFRFTKLLGNYDCELVPCQFKRLYADVKDLNLQNVPELASKPLIGTCKHLCGSATDLGLNCLLTQKADLFIFAPCCHHCSSMDTFLYNVHDLPTETLIKFYSHFKPKYDLDSTPEILFQQIFKSICKLSSWATRKVEKESMEGILLGRKAKYFLDELRCKYVGQLGYAVEQYFYCDSTITPENRIMVFTKINSDS